MNSTGTSGGDKLRDIHKLEFDEEDDGVSLFNKALNKKQFQGNKGHLLMELQQSYKDDKRFLLDKKFKDDIDSSKVSGSIKKMTHLFDKDFRNKKEETPLKIIDTMQEKNNNLSILSQIIPNSEFLTNNKKFYNPKKLLIKRFDPKLNIGTDLIIKPNDTNKIKEDKNLIKLDKGMSKSNEDLLPADRLKKFEKEKFILKEMNALQDNLESKVEINYDSWNNIIKVNNNNEENKAFCLFDEGEILKPKRNIDKNQKQVKIDKIIKPIAIETFNLFDTDKDKNTSENQTKENVKDNEEQILLLKRKRKNEKKKLKEKEKKEQFKMEEKLKDEKIEMVLKKNMLKEFETDKVENYIRYVNLIREKKIIPSREINSNKLNPDIKK